SHHIRLVRCSELKARRTNQRDQARRTLVITGLRPSIVNAGINCAATPVHHMVRRFTVAVVVKLDGRDLL
uniref:hypothetical protein n=1 Tax=Roseiconus lacunae TaxID=2605694 RepID=UPI001F383689